MRDFYVCALKAYTLKQGCYGSDVFSNFMRASVGLECAKKKEKPGM